MLAGHQQAGRRWRHDDCEDFCACAFMNGIHVIGGHASSRLKFTADNCRFEEVARGEGMGRLRRFRGKSVGEQRATKPRRAGGMLRRGRGRLDACAGHGDTQAWSRLGCRRRQVVSRIKRVVKKVLLI